MTDISYEIHIGATPEVVYAHMTQSEGLIRWMGIDGLSDPVAGGDLTWTHENGATMIGRFVSLDPPHRLKFTYGWKDSLMGIPPESTTVEVTLTRTDSGTRVELVHTGLPPDHAFDHHGGWHHFLSKLASHLDT